MSDELRRHIRDELEKATFKIIIENEIVGTGFFISPDGYFLTACHCVKDMRFGGDTKFFLTLEFFNGGRLQDEVFFDEAKSNMELDLAVIKSNYNPKACLPLGRITKDHIESEITALGFPAGYKEGRGLGFYKGTIPRFIENNKQQFETSLAIQGAGQSGGPVYHYGTHRVVGLVQEKYDPKDMSSAGLALRFDSLFKQWTELKAMNDDAAEAWDRQIRPFIKKDKPEAKCGRIIPKLCNREDQTKKFWHFFTNTAKECPQRPHFYFIHGNSGEGHESFIERMMEEHIKKYAEDKWQKEKSSVCRVEVHWPDTGDIEDRKISLKWGPFLKFNKGFSEPECSLTDLQQLCGKHQFVAICYNMDVSKWKKTDEDLLRWYMREYWASFECSSDIPLFLIFFNLKYPRSKVFSFMQRIKKIFGCDCFSKECFHELAENTADTCPCLPEIELKPIGLKDLEHWFEEYRQCIKDNDPRIIKSILKRCKTAETIEQELEKLIEFHNRE